MESLILYNNIFENFYSPFFISTLSLLILSLVSLKMEVPTSTGKRLAPEQTTTALTTEHRTNDWRMEETSEGYVWVYL